MADQIDHAFMVQTKLEDEAKSRTNKRNYLVIFELDGEIVEAPPFFGTRGGCTIFAEEQPGVVLDNPNSRWAYGYGSDDNQHWASDGAMEQELLSRLTAQSS